MAQRDTVSDWFEALADPHRRVVLYYLREHEEASLARLAECVTGWIDAGPGRNGETREYRTVELELHHRHLPMLADAGIATYDREGGRVALGAVPDVVDRLLDAAAQADVTDDRATLETVLTAGTDGAE